MKKQYQIIPLIIALLSNAQLWAYDFEYNGICYHELENNQCEVTYKSREYDSYKGEVVIPAVVYDYSFSSTPLTVTGIGKLAFALCSKLTSVSMPSTIQSIKDDAFASCPMLKSIEIPDGVVFIGEEAFGGCSGLSTITLPNTVRTLGDIAFAQCTGLTSVTLSSSLSKIGEDAFYLCSNLQTILVPESVKSIGPNAFNGCKSLTEVTIGSGVTSIGEEAFSECPNLKIVRCLPGVPPTITSTTFDQEKQISLIVPNDSYASAPYWCDFTNITTSAEIITPGEDPSSNTPKTFTIDALSYEVISEQEQTCRLTAISESIGKELFIPGSVASAGKTYKVTEVAKGAIRSISVDTLSIPFSVETLSDSAIVDSYISTLLIHPESIDQEFLCYSYIKTLILTPEVKSLKCQLKNNGVNKVVIEDCTEPLELGSLGITPLETWEVYLGRNLTSPNHVYFSNIPWLLTLTIGAQVTEIDSGTFNRCDQIESIYTYNPVPPIMNCTFEQNIYQTTKVYTPEAALPDYKAADGWKEFKNIEWMFLQYDRYFVADGWKYEVLSEINHTCRLYKASGNLIGEILIPDSAAQNGTYFRVIQVAPNAFDGVNVDTLYMNENQSFSADAISNSSVKRLVVRQRSIEEAFISNSTVEELVITPEVLEFNYNLQGNNVVKLTIEDSNTELTTPANNGFSCQGTQEVYLGRDLLGWGFFSLYNIQTARIGKKVTSIDKFSLCGHASLRTLISESPVPPTVDGKFASATYSEGTLYVPAEAISAYQSANGWKDFFNILPMEGTLDLGAVSADASFPLFIQGHMLRIEGTASFRIANLQGVTLYQGCGNVELAISSGIYLVTIGRQTRKVIIP
jgi:hypothetical protein